MRPSASKRTASAASTGGAGCVTDEQFQAAFEAVPDTKINSVRELISECQKTSTFLENADNDWHARVKSLQTLRSLIRHSEKFSDFHNFVDQSHSLVTQALVISVKDLRSQVCREACITIAYYSMKIGTEFYRTVEAVLPTTINLCQNSAKVMASSGFKANFYITKHVHHPRILALIIQQISHKAKEVRRNVMTLLSNVINSWNVSIYEKNWPEIIECVRASLCDADNETRAIARQTYDGLQSSHPQIAESIFQNLDPARQRLLSGHASAASSTHSINSERDTLPTPNRGLYNRQNAFFNDRSKSDLNHAFRRLNIGVRMNAHKPHVVNTAKPPHAGLPTPQQRANSFTPNQAPNVVKKPILSPKPKVPQSPIATNSSNTKPQQPRNPSNSPGRGQGQQRMPDPTPQTGIVNGNNTPLRGVTLSKDPKVRGIRPNVVRTRTGPGPVNGAGHYPGIELTPVKNLGDIYGHHESPIVPRSTNASEGRKSSLDGLIRSSLVSNSTRPSNTLTPKAPNKFTKYMQEMTIDPNSQNLFLEEVYEVLMKAKNDSEINETEFSNALDVLSNAIKHDMITFWDEHFLKLFGAIQYVVSNCHSNLVKGHALRSMKELCISQPTRMAIKAEMILMNVLNAQTDDATVIRNAEDCGIAVIDCITPTKSMELLVIVIDDENTKPHQLSAAIKMLSNVISRMSDAEVRRTMNSLIPRMVKCYENSNSMVRRAAILCLVAIGNVVGMQELGPVLSPSTLKLVEVYRDRLAQKGKVSL